MNLSKILFMILLGLLVVSSVVFAGDFDWMRNFNIKAEADLPEFRARLEARFKVGDIEIETVLNNVEKPAEAYMLLRLGEMSNQPIRQVIKNYKAKKNKGWGVLAKSLGIKTGSKDFHALKQVQDIYDDKVKGVGKINSKGKGKERK